ncbi:MAG: HK97 family phage prohead protease [Sandarakinorhabdus sp.]|nr:HK97 family phage prohead protease [Sandarakinorhabdus sp.]
MGDLRIAGYASVFNVPDKGGDVVLKGAFASAGRPVPLLWQHDASEPVGIVEAMSEDARGLRITARIVDAGRGAAAAALLRAGAIDGLSFGYRVKAARADRLRGVRELSQLDLIEVSLVTFPMQPLARVLGFSTVTEETMYDL